MHADTGAAGDSGDVTVDGAGVHRLVVVAFDEQPAVGGSAPCPVVVDQPDEHRVQRHGAVVVQLAERDAQPPGVTEAIHGVVAQPAEFTDPHPGAGQQLDDQAAPLVRLHRQRGHELGRRRIVEELRQWLIGLGDVTGENRHPARRVGIVPVDDPLEERAQHPEPVADRLGRRRAATARAVGERELERLDVTPLHRGHRHTRRIGHGEMVGELAQGEPRAVDGARPRRHRDLVQVGGHRRCHLRRPLGDLAPTGDGGGSERRRPRAVDDIACRRSRPATSRRHRNEDRCISISTFAEMLEEPAQLTDAAVDAAGRDGSPGAPLGMQRQPQAVVADVVPGDPGGRRAGRVDDTDVTGELPQRRAHRVHGRR